MSLVAIATAFTVVMLVASVMLGWIADLKRAGGAVSARESRAAAEADGRAFYTSRSDRAEAMKERIRRERMRRERARGPKAPTATAGTPEPDRPAARPPTPEELHRAVLELVTWFWSARYHPLGTQHISYILRCGRPCLAPSRAPRVRRSKLTSPRRLAPQDRVATMVMMQGITEEQKKKSEEEGGMGLS